MDEHRLSLKNYIQQQLQSGLSPDHITEQLRIAGWPEQEIHLAFTTIQAEIMPGSLAHLAPATTVSQISPPKANGNKRGRIRTGWQLLKQSLTLLNNNRHLLRYLAMTAAWVFGITIVLVLVYHFAFAYLYSDSYSQNLNIFGYMMAFLDYLLVYFFINLYAAGLTANVLDLFQGQKQSYQAYMQIAWSKAPAILVFSIISASVGMLLQYVVERVRWIGWILAWILGTMWSLGTMFVIPIIVTSERPSGVTSIKHSVKFFKQTWGENVIAKVGVNGPLFILNLAAIGLLGLGFYLAISVQSLALMWAIVITYFAISIGLAVIGSFANSIINIALFYYATQHTVPPAFSADMLNQIFVNRKRSRLGKKLPVEPVV